uniref:Copia protein n=1 Tax=Tanacetum cinerariifolium TaxID=118510 RepID=A0A6L2JC99_TANCI|nr:copia protein [Tanacetum cinerariifolium]
MKLYMQGKDHGRMILNSVENGPMVWPNVTLEDGTTVRPMTYEELSKLEKLHNTCDLKAANIDLQGLPPDVFGLVNHHKVAKEIWDIVKLLMHGTSLTKQEQECELYNEFDKFTHVKGETLYTYYLRFNQLINDMNTINMTMQTVQVYTKFLKSLSYKWGKFMTDVKLARDLHTSSFNQLYGSGITDGSVDQTFTHNAIFQTDDLDAYDSDCDEIPSVAAILMTNLSSCDLKTVFEVQYYDYAQNDVFTQSVHELQYSEQSQNVIYLDIELTSDSNVIPYSQYLEESQQASVPHTDISPQQNCLIVSMFEQISGHATSWDSTNKENKLVNESLTAELDRYRERVKILEQRNNVDLSTKERESIKKQKDPEMEKKKVNCNPINYAELNKLSEDFGKCFVPQQELSTEQMFWLSSSDKNSVKPSTSNSHVKIDVPSEIPKGFEHTKKVFVTEVIPWLKVFKDCFQEFEKNLLDEITEVQNAFTQMEAVMEQCFVDKKLNVNDESVDTCEKCLKLKAEFLKKNDIFNVISKRFSHLEKHRISLEVAMQLSQEIFQKDISYTKQSYPDLQEYFKLNDLKAQLQAKDTIIITLKEKVKALIGILECVKHDIDEIETTNIELKHSVAKERLIAVTPMNKDSKVRPADPVTSSKHSAKFVAFITRNKNKQPSGNTKKYKISQPPSSNKTNKVEDQPKGVKTRKNKKDRVYQIKSHADDMQSVLNTNSKSMCDVCNECLFDANHDKCVVNCVHDVNVILIVIWYLDSGCSKHMTENHSQLTNFVDKFLGTVKFGHNLFSVGQFCDSDLEVAFRKHTCFVRNLGGKDILLVQIYVDDIIFASTDLELCESFSDVMCSKFMISMMGKLSFFPGLQISQSPRGIFLNQSKYALGSLKMYGMETSKQVDTPMVDKSKLDEDPKGKAVDPTRHREMIGTLMYLTSSRPNLIFDVCMCVRYQAKPTKKHLHAVKRIFKYLRGTINMGLWYSKYSFVALIAFADADHAENGVVELYFVETDYQLANIFTKALPRERLNFLIEKLGMKIMSPETLISLAEEDVIMNPQEIKHVIARDEAWVPAAERVKISPTNVRLETTVQQKEETFQVVIDLIKNSTCLKAFKISVDVPTIQKAKDSESYEFLLANKICVVDAEVFMKVLDICLRNEGEEFTESKGKGSQGKKTRDTAKENVHVSEDSDPEPLVRKKTSKRSVAKKKATISAADNIVPDPDLALELGKQAGDNLVLVAQMKELDADNVESENKEKEEMTDAAKVDAEKTVSSDYGDQFLDLSYSDNLSSVVKDSSDAESKPLLDVHIQKEIPQITTLPPPQFTSTISHMLQTTPIQTTIPTPPIITAVPEITSLIAVQLKVTKVEQDVSELKKIDHSVAALASIQS